MQGIVGRSISLLLPPNYRQGDANQIRLGRLVVYSAVVVFLAGCFYTTIYLALGIRLAATGPGQAILIVPLSLWLFRRTQSILLAGNLIAFTCTLGVGMVVLGTGGVHSPALPWFYFGPLIAMMTAGRRSGIAWYAIVTVVAFVFGLLGNSSILPTSEIPKDLDAIHDVAVAVGLITVVTSAAWSFSYTQEIASNKLGEATKLAEHACGKAEMARANAMLVLDNVNDGLAIVDLDGRLVGEASARFREWFGQTTSDSTIWQWLNTKSKTLAESLEVNWEQLRSDWMPLELGLEQLPKRFDVDGRFFKLNYQPVVVDDELHHILVICSDITAELEAEHANEIQREQMAIFTRFVRDPRNTRNFLCEADRLVAKISGGAGTPTEERRWIHTLKGNCGIFGLNTFARWLHHLEDELTNDFDSCGNSCRDMVASQWTAIRARLSSIVDIERTDQITVDRDVFESTIQAAEAGVPSAELARAMRRWTWDHVGKRLELLAERAKNLADRLGKSGLIVSIESDEVRHPPGEAWNAFWSSIVHVVRNAIDHGVEPPEERIRLGKDAAGQLSLRANKDEDDTFIFEVADDGAGINWIKVARKCEILGLNSDCPRKLHEAVFVDGMSTKEVATETSGRGVGMAAVREACRALGGDIEIESTDGKGTTFRFTFPPVDVTLSE